MFIPSQSENSTKDWNDFTLVLPTVSIGNVGQLTTDLLISTLRPCKVGYLYTDCVIPVVGNNPFVEHGSPDMFEITTALEVYESVPHKLIIVQQRSSCIKGRRAKFVDELKNWIKTCAFKQVFILSSIFNHERRDQQLVGPQTRYLLTPKAEEMIGDKLKNINNWIALEKRPSDLTYLPTDSEIFVPGSGIAKPLFQNCSIDGVAAALLVIFCAEGDNIAESIQLATFVNSYFNWVPFEENLDVQRQLWKIPSSWKLQFGSHFNSSLY